MNPSQESSRRDFLKNSTTAAATGALATSLSLGRSAHASGNDRFNIALIGAGNRGTGAAADCLNAAENVRLVAVADLYEQRAKRSLKLLKENLGDQVAVPNRELLPVEGVSSVAR